MKAYFKKYTLKFKFKAQTSRETLQTKETYVLTIEHKNKVGVGECGFFKGLSFDDELEYENKLNWLCENINLGFNILYNELIFFPSIQFGLEQAFINLNQIDDIYFPSIFTEGKAGIKINGLIWMGEFEEIQNQINKKIKDKFSCIKLKIGQHNWENEYKLLKELRLKFPKQKLEIRVDANGAFNPKQAVSILEKLAELEIHSIEQPIKKGQIEEMSYLCKISPIPIALDEELIGVLHKRDKIELLEKIQPQYIILKPSLVGGFKRSVEWIELAQQLNIGWWITSALESNIGLNAIAQWTYTLRNSMPQGLGTGNLYSNNFTTKLKLKGDVLFYNPDLK